MRLCPGRRRSRSTSRSSTERARPGGTPSSMTTFAGPWLSPAVVILSAWPKLLPGMGHLNGDQRPDANDRSRHENRRTHREKQRESARTKSQKSVRIGFLSLRRSLILGRSTGRGRAGEQGVVRHIFFRHVLAYEKHRRGFRMTAADLLRNAQPPSDDGLIEKAIAELDVKLFEWTDALKSAHAQLRSAFAVRPASRPSQALYDNVATGAAPASPPLAAAPPPLAALAAAAHMPSAAPLPQWAAPPVTEADAAAWSDPLQPVPDVPAPSPWTQAPPAPSSAWAPSAPAAFQDSRPPSSGSEWPQSQPPSPFGGHGISSGASAQQPSTVAWPTAPSGNWPEAPPTNTNGPQAWPTWNPTDTSASGPKKSSVRASRAPKAVRQTL